MDLTNCRHILLIRPSALGDVCRTVPLVVSLKRAFEGANVDWIVQDAFVDAVRYHPDVNEVIAFPRRRFGSWWHSYSVLNEMMQWVGRLRSRRYDLVVDAQGLGRSGMIAFASGGRMRVGPANAREGAWLGYNHRVRVPADAHAVDGMLALLTGIGVEPIADMQLYCGDSDHRWWVDCRKQRDIGEHYAVLAPTARWASKRWPLDRWAALAAKAASMIDGRCVVIGSASEREQVGDAFAGMTSVVDLIGETTVGQTMAIIECAKSVVANDSAPLHMAAGFSRPCVGLFGPTDPAMVGPVGDRSAVVSSWPGNVHYRDKALDDRLMRRIELDEVVQALAGVLDR